MTREKLLSLVPRSRRLSEKTVGRVRAAVGSKARTVDSLHSREDSDAIVLTELLVELGDGAEQ